MRPPGSSCRARSARGSVSGMSSRQKSDGPNARAPYRRTKRSTSRTWSGFRTTATVGGRASSRAQTSSAVAGGRQGVEDEHLAAGLDARRGHEALPAQAGAPVRVLGAPDPEAVGDVAELVRHRSLLASPSVASARPAAKTRRSRLRLAQRATLRSVALSPNVPCAAQSPGAGASRLSGRSGVHGLRGLLGLDSLPREVVVEERRREPLPPRSAASGLRRAARAAGARPRRRSRARELGLVDRRHRLGMPWQLCPAPLELGRIERGQVHHRHVDSAAVVEQLGPQRLGEALERVLGGAVRGLQRDAAVRERRADLDDRAAVARPHPPQRGQRPVDGPQVGDGGGARVLVRVELPRPGVDGGHRVVHPDVDGAELLPPSALRPARPLPDRRHRRARRPRGRRDPRGLVASPRAAPRRGRGRRRRSRGRRRRGRPHGRRRQSLRSRPRRAPASRSGSCAGRNVATGATAAHRAAVREAWPRGPTPRRAPIPLRAAGIPTATRSRRARSGAPSRRG